MSECYICKGLILSFQGNCRHSPIGTGNFYPAHQECVKKDNQDNSQGERARTRKGDTTIKNSKVSTPESSQAINGDGTPDNTIKEEQEVKE